MIPTKFSIGLVGVALGLAFSGREAKAWAPKTAPIQTRWANQIDSKAPLPEYPRPQLVRSQWQSLNGVWQYQSGAEGDALPTGKTLGSEILVPYPVESAASGVMEHHDRLWYRRTFTVPKSWQGQQLKLNFGAVDYEAQVYVNGQSVGVHTGGYESFSYDITPFLKGTGPQELIVRVFDPTELGGQPRGKQTQHPGGIMYTPTTGIWQTVWLEPVAKASIENIHMVPDVDNSRVRFTVNAPNASAATNLVVKIKDGDHVVATTTAKPGLDFFVPIVRPKLWSPDTPFLYDVDISLRNGKKESDHVTSYFGMRKISVGLDNGVPKILLNNKFVFELGPLDQGFWPESLYTPPTEDALKADIATMKTLGFNMVRKHIKVEPARWYYWTDKMGLLVWQDMPSPDSYIKNPPPVDKAAFEKQLNQVITSHWNVPSIVMWVIFNENQGRYDTARLVSMAKILDPSRLVDRDSGSGHEARDSDVGDVDDVHSYPSPGIAAPSPKQALVCGEYGGIGYVIKEHSWTKQGWGYTSVVDPQGLEETYGEFSNDVKQLRDNKGLSAAVYTQLTDVEIESNGLMTYDRVLKPNVAQIALANRFQYPSPTYQAIVPTSEKASQTWKYTLTQPDGGWKQKNFDDSGWQTGAGGFGSTDNVVPGAPRIGTPWKSDDIWLRRTFNPGPLDADALSQLVLRDYHDEDIEVFINGERAYASTGYTTSYEEKAIRDAAKNALIANADNVIAVHCHQTQGGQYLDVGIDRRIPGKG